MTAQPWKCVLGLHYRATRGHIREGKSQDREHSHQKERAMGGKHTLPSKMCDKICTHTRTHRMGVQKKRLLRHLVQQNGTNKTDRK